MPYFLQKENKIILTQFYIYHFISILLLPNAPI